MTSPPHSNAKRVKATICAICNLQPSKYTCPACSTRTCSLPCSVRHKAWKSCSGVRSPSTYLPRPALATSSSLDRDYNFLSGLDRDIERREDRIAEKGIKLGDEGAQRASNSSWGGGGKKKGEQKVGERCWELGVRVVRAPKGLQRSRENRTQWDGGKNVVMWCVEWIEDEGRSLSLLSETLSIGDGWTRVIEEKHKVLKKRKRGEEEDLSRENPRSFYLHLPRPPPKTALKPRTKALVLLDKNTALHSCLKNQVIIEYPTIVVFSRPSGEVPDGYIILEEREVAAIADPVAIDDVSNQCHDDRLDEKLISLSNALSVPSIETKTPQPEEELQDSVQHLEASPIDAEDELVNSKQSHDSLTNPSNTKVEEILQKTEEPRIEGDSKDFSEIEIAEHDPRPSSTADVAGAARG
jgi:hypothetical protein